MSKPSSSHGRDAASSSDSSDQAPAARPKIQKTPSRPSSRLEALPQEEPGTSKDSRHRSSATSGSTVRSAHHHCCAKPPAKHGGVILGAARKQVPSTADPATGNALSKATSTLQSRDHDPAAKENTPTLTQLGAGAKYPYQTDAIGYLQFIQHQANLLHTLQQHRMKTEEEKATHAAGAEGDNTTSDETEAESGEDEESKTDATEAAQQQDSSNNDDEDDEDDDDEEEEEEGDEEDVTSGATAAAAIDNPDPALISLEKILNIGGISLAEFKSWKSDNDRAPLELNARLLQCMTSDNHATALVLCQRVLQIEPDNQLMAELYPTIMSRLKQGAYKEVQRSLDCADSDSEGSTSSEEDETDSEDESETGT